MDLERLPDEGLLVLAREQPGAFAAFYRRHVPAVHSYVRRRVYDSETAFDLTAETFAAALRAVPRYEVARNRRGPSLATSCPRACAAGRSRTARAERSRCSRSSSTRPIARPRPLA